MSLTLVTLDNAHEIIPKFIADNNIIIGSYEDTMNVILKMISAKYFFNMDKNILRGCLEDLTYMYSPGDDVNKDRVVAMLEPSDDEDDDDDSDGDGMGGMGNMMEMMMKQMGGAGLEEMVKEERPSTPPPVHKECDNCPENSCEDCPVEEVKEDVEEVKEDVEDVE